MGDRGQIRIRSDIGSNYEHNIYLYGHWSASELHLILQEAMKKRWRWNDSEYLTRIIFDVLVGSDQGDETGYGIGNHKHGDIYRLIEVNCDEQKIIVFHVGFADSDEQPKTVLWEGSFEEYVSSNLPKSFEEEWE